MMSHRPSAHLPLLPPMIHPTQNIIRPVGPLDGYEEGEVQYKDRTQQQRTEGGKAPGCRLEKDRYAIRLMLLHKFGQIDSSMKSLIYELTDCVLSPSASLLDGYGF